MGTHFLWNPINDNIVKEFDDAGNTIADYTTEPNLYGDLISQHRDGQSSFYHYDGQGSTTSLTDSAANVTDTYAYAAFGEVTEHTGSTINPFQYNGEKQYYRNDATGEYEIRRRVLTLTNHRWLCVDPLLFSADNTSRRFARQLNAAGESPYLYCSNRPTEFIDPSGLTKGYWWLYLKNMGNMLYTLEAAIECKKGVLQLGPPYVAYYNYEGFLDSWGWSVIAAGATSSYQVRIDNVETKSFPKENFCSDKTQQPKWVDTAVNPWGSDIWTGILPNNLG